MKYYYSIRHAMIITLTGFDSLCLYVHAVVAKLYRAGALSSLYNNIIDYKYVVTIPPNRQELYIQNHSGKVWPTST